MEKYLDMCQRPKRAFLISTFNNGYNRTNRLLCVNALNGLFLFLLHFILKMYRSSEGVNALNGLFLFLPGIQSRNDCNSVCVNALNGLFLFLQISTTQHFYPDK